MQTITAAVEYILSFQAYTMLPLIILAFSLLLRVPAGRALQASLTIAVGFVGIFMVFDFFVAALAPAVTALSERTGMDMPVLDVGWPPLAAITWGYPLAAILIPVTLLVNILLLIPGWTKTINIDIWNFWHFIFLAAMIAQTTGSTVLAILFAVIASIITLKLADGARTQLTEFADLKGITISTLSALTYYPIGLVGNRLIECIPGIRSLQADPESLRRRLGLLGEPMALGFIIGIALGITAGYELRDLLELAVQIAAVVAILPLMSGILSKGLMIVSEEMTEFLKRRIPRLADAAIGMDVAIIVGRTSIIVAAVLLIPVALILAFILPGIRFVPIGDLANMVGLVAMITVATRGNVIRSVLIGIPVLVGVLYTAGTLAPLFTELAADAGFTVSGFDGQITSFLDGGNLLRIFLFDLSRGAPWAFFALPGVALLLFATWRILRRPAETQPV
ncbi:MAG: PTS galactitol transporter subunit IIC [Spirochaeta sp.]